MDSLIRNSSFALSVFMTIVFCVTRQYRYLTIGVACGIGLRVIGSILANSQFAPLSLEGHVGSIFYSDLFFGILPAWITLGLAGSLNTYQKNFVKFCRTFAFGGGVRT